VQVGSGTNGVNGLTGNYFASALNCVGQQYTQAGFTGCAAPSAGAFGERNFNTTLWASAVPTQNGPSGETAGLQLTDTHDGVTFAMLNEGGNSTNNYWGGSGSAAAGPAVITIPIGIFGVSEVWTMLNDYWGMNGVNNTTVTLNFDNKSDGSDAGSATTEVFNLVNGVQIRSATDCTAKGVTLDCTAFSRTTSSAGTSNAFAASYSNDTLAGSPFIGTSGNLTLDDQAFAVILANEGKWLVNVQVSNSNGGSGTSGTPSRTALTAITVQTVPEPATFGMILGGLALLGAARRKLKS